VSNRILEQEGPDPRVAEKVLAIRWGTASLLVGAIAGTVFGLYLERRLKPGEIDRQLRGGLWISRTAVVPDP
jgi:hypothetical protein